MLNTISSVDLKINRKKIDMYKRKEKEFKTNARKIINEMFWFIKYKQNTHCPALTLRAFLFAFIHCFSSLVHSVNAESYSRLELIESKTKVYFLIILIRFFPHFYLFHFFSGTHAVVGSEFIK